MANLSLPGPLSADLLSASANGGNNQVASQASVANVNLTVPRVTVTASVLTSTGVSCTPQGGGCNSPE